MSDGPLDGFVVGVTADRRASEQAELLRRRGAEVVLGPSIETAYLASDHALRAATVALVERPPRYLAATTGIGIRAWFEAAQVWGLGDALLDAVRETRILARGPKAAGAVQAAASTCGERGERADGPLLDLLLSEPLAGACVAVQLYGTPAPEFTAALVAAGAQVLEVPVYRWQTRGDPGPALRLAQAAIDGRVHAVTFTAAPAVVNLFALAAEAGLEERLRNAFNRRGVVAACVGPVCARGALESGILAPLGSRRGPPGADGAGPVRAPRLRASHGAHGRRRRGSPRPDGTGRRNTGAAEQPGAGTARHPCRPARHRVLHGPRSCGRCGALPAPAPMPSRWRSPDCDPGSARPAPPWWRPREGLPPPALRPQWRSGATTLAGRKAEVHGADMLRPPPLLVGVLAAVVLGTGVSAAAVRTGDETSSPAVTTSTVQATTTVVSTTTSTAPSTAPATTVRPAETVRPTTTRATTPPQTTPPTTRPVTTTPVPTTIKPPLTRAAATQALCRDIEASVRLVVDGNTIGGGVRLLGAVNTYGDAADPTVVAPARRMLSAGINGDLEASAVATREAATACLRLGYPINLPGPIQCIQAPCP